MHAGVDRVFTDQASGRQDDRPGLAAALAALHAGDVLVVWKLDAISVAKALGDIPQEVNFAVKGDETVAFLKRAGVAVRFEPATAPVATADVAAMARAFTVQLLCW